jgi:hypothetical protein
MRILFIEVIHQKLLYLKLSAELKKHKCEIFVLTFSQKRKQFYISNGCRCVDISEFEKKGGINLVSADDLIFKLESKYKDYKLDQAIRKDRFIWWRRNYGKKYITSKLKAFESIVEEITPDLIIGETATALEYTFSFFSQLKSIPYRQILTYPTDFPSIALFDYSLSIDSMVRYRVNAGKNSSKIEGLNYYQQLDKLREKNEKQLTGQSFHRYISELPFTYTANDYRTHLSYKIRYLIIKIYRLFYWFIEKLFAGNINSTDSFKYLFALHVQPEATPDYVSINYSNQFQLIEEIISDLPEGAYLYIKEHPTVWSLRNPFKLLQLLKNKKIRLLWRNFPTKDKLSSFDIVFSVCGTVLLEASKAGVPAICFSNCFYKTLDNVFDRRQFGSMASAIDAAHRGVKILNDKNLVWNEEFVHPGFYADVGLVPSVLDDQNIRNITKMILLYLEKFNKLEQERF